MYLDHIIKLKEPNQDAEIKRKTQLTWTVFCKLVYILKNNSILINSQRKVNDTCLLPVSTYGVETMYTKSAKNLETTETAMKRNMLMISPKDNVGKTEIRRRTKVWDIVEEVTKMKWPWSDQIDIRRQRMNTRRILEWRQQES